MILRSEWRRNVGETSERARRSLPKLSQDSRLGLQLSRWWRGGSAAAATHRRPQRATLRAALRARSSRPRAATEEQSGILRRATRRWWGTHLQLHHVDVEAHHGPLASADVPLGNGSLLWFEVSDSMRL